MNIFVYLGYAIVCLIAALIFIAVFLGIFVCVDNWFEDQYKEDDHD